MSSKWTGNKSGNRLQHDGNSCLQSGVSGRQQNEVSHRGTTSHSHAYVHHTNLIRSGDQSGDSIRKWRDSYSKTCLSSLYVRARPKLPPVQVSSVRTTLYTPGHRRKLIVVSKNKTFVLTFGSPKSGDQSGDQSEATTARGTDPAFCQDSHPSRPIRRRTRRLWPISIRQAGDQGPH